MTDTEREILRLMHDLQVELVEHQGAQITALRAAMAGLNQAVDSLDRSHAIVAKLMKATADLIRVS